MTHLINIPMDSLNPWGIPEGICEAPESSLANELKFRFIIGDRGNIYDVRACIDPFACTSWYWEFRVHILKNFKLQLHCEHYLRIPIAVPSMLDMVGIAERYLKDAFIRKIITETIQPEDFYE